VLNAGQVVEVNDAGAIIADPQSDYTKALVAAAPQLRSLNHQHPPVTQERLTGTTTL
jgi:ABC-type glutathione transport system ATPase component